MILVYILALENGLITKRDINNVFLPRVEEALKNIGREDLLN